MPTFNFAPIKLKVNKRQSKELKDSIIEKNIKGVVWIDLNGDFSVHIKEDIYLIKKECYSCKGRDKVFYIPTNTNEKRICFVRAINEYVELNNLYYLPFSYGCVVIGNIVFIANINKKVFDIKSINIDFIDWDARNACEFYRKNKEIINKAIENKRLNAIR